MGHDIILRLLIINLKEEYIRFNDHAYDDLQSKVEKETTQVE